MSVESAVNRLEKAPAPDLSMCVRALAENPGNADLIVALGNRLLEQGNFAAAAANFRKALLITPGHEAAQVSLHWALQGQTGSAHAAVTAYRTLLERRRILRRDLAQTLLELGWAGESFRQWQAVLQSDPASVAWIHDTATDAMEKGDLARAAELAAIDTGLRLGSQWYPPGRDPDIPVIQLRSVALTLTIPKLRHDVEQFAYLQQRGILGTEFNPIIAEYERVIGRLEKLGPEPNEPLADEEQRSIGHVYNRIVHVRETPRVPHALSARWDPRSVESEYFGHPPGLAIVDNFLSEEAVHSLRLFCLESTIWSANHYRHGRLGSFFRDGFNCPLLIQIAEELREVLPRLIGRRHPLRQLWGFKYGTTLPGRSTHADFAAVNVNFWITPESANLDPESGGLFVYNVEAPPEWDFDTYNRRSDVINAFLEGQNATAVNIPYRANRAIIFNSDLFHSTAGMEFRPGYENRRVNITFLYGDRKAPADGVGDVGTGS
jgi:tetratricopeptide (TPR) repeat protein